MPKKITREEQLGRATHEEPIRKAVELYMQKRTVVERPMTAKQAAAFLQISVPTFRRKLRRGEIPFHRLSERKIRFLPSELIEALKRV